MIDSMAGNYRLVAKLGAGGMGEVYRAVHTTIGSKVAIKVLHATGDADAEERFLREAKAVNLIEHDGVVKVLDAGRTEHGRPYLVMELLDGKSLQDHMRERPLSAADACKVMADVLDALAAAHAAGVVHRDLKPANIFRTKTGRTVVLDFGIAKLVSAERLTMAGFAVGTPQYMAPEQIMDKDVGPATDIYTAGIVLFELLTERLPFDGQTIEVLNAHIDRPAPSPLQIRPDLPASLADIVVRALQKEPARRFPSAAAMRDALRSAMSTLGMPAAAPTKTQDAVAPTAQLATKDLQFASSATAPVVVPTRVERARSEPAPPPPMPTVHVPDVVPAAPAAAPTKSRAPLFALLAVLVLGGGIAAAVALSKSSSKSEPARAVVALADGGVAPGDAALVAAVEDALVADAGVDAALSKVPWDKEAVAQARTLPSMRGRRVNVCPSEADAELARPQEDDPALDAVRSQLARYENQISCKHLTAHNLERWGTLRDALEDALHAGDTATAAGLVRRLLAEVDAIQIDQRFVRLRMDELANLRGDVSDMANDRIEELLRDAVSEWRAEHYKVANLLVDEAMKVALNSMQHGR